MKKSETVRIAEQVRRARERAGMTQAVLAERSGLSLDTVRSIEQGRRTPSLHTCHRIAVATKTNLLLDFE